MRNQPRPNPTLSKYLTGDALARLNFFIELGSLAPSPYNTQPWRFAKGKDTIVITPDFSRRLVEADPALRGLYFTLGAVAENIILGSKALGVSSTLTLEGTGEQFRCAIRLSGFEKKPGAIDFATIDAIKTRHTNRFAFAPQDLPDALKNFIESENVTEVASHYTSDPGLVGKLQELTQDAVKQIFRDKKFTKELSAWLKSSRARHKSGMPGYVLGIPTWFSFVLPRLIRFGSAKIVTKAQQKVHARWFDSAQTLGYIGAKTETPELVFEAGRCFERIAVESQKYGVVLGPMSALIEATGFEGAVQHIFKTTTRPIMIYRIGYATTVPPQSPRFHSHEITDA